MKKNLTLFASLLLVLGFTFSSCTKEDDVKTGGEYVVVLSYAPAEGYDYSYYPIQVESLMGDTTISAVGVGNITQVGYYEYTQLGQTIYSTGGLDYTDVSAIAMDASDELASTDFGVNFTSAIQDVITADDGDLLAIEMSSSSDIVVLHHIDAETYTLVKSDTTSALSISSNITADKLPTNSGFAQSGDYIFVSYFMFDASYATPHVDEAEVAVFSYPELEYIKTITDDRTGPIGGWATNSGLFSDENGNIYALSHTNLANGYSQSNTTAGFLRINNGSSEFDSEYFFDLSATGDGYTTANALYLENNKVFAEMNVQARSQQTAWSDGPLKGAILDLEAQSVSYFSGDVTHYGPGRDIESTALYTEGYIYNPITVDGVINLYRFDPSDMSVTKGAQIDASFVAGTFRLQ